MAIEALQYLADEAKESNNSGGLIMPLYEYLCKKCGQSFAFTMTVGVGPILRTGVSARN